MLAYIWVSGGIYISRAILSSSCWDLAFGPPALLDQEGAPRIDTPAGAVWCTLTARRRDAPRASALDPEVLLDGRVERPQRPEADAQGAEAGAEAEPLRAHAAHHLAVPRVHLPAQTHGARRYITLGGPLYFHRGTVRGASSVVYEGLTS